MNCCQVCQHNDPWQIECDSCIEFNKFKVMDMKSNFIVKCPYCKKINDFNDDNWCDALVDDSDTTELECMHCDYPMDIITHAVYTLEVKPYDGAVSCDFAMPHEEY